MFFGFAFTPQQGQDMWFLLEQPPAGYRFRADLRDRRARRRRIRAAAFQRSNTRSDPRRRDLVSEVSYSVALTDRIEFLNARVSELEDRASAATDQRLAAAPPWYRPGIRTPRLDPARLAIFGELEQLRERATEARADLRGLRDLLQEAAMDPARWNAVRCAHCSGSTKPRRGASSRAASSPIRHRRNIGHVDRALYRIAASSTIRAGWQRTFQAILDFRDQQPRRR